PRLVVVGEALRVLGRGWRTRRGPAPRAEEEPADPGGGGGDLAGRARHPSPCLGPPSRLRSRELRGSGHAHRAAPLFVIGSRADWLRELGRTLTCHRRKGYPKDRNLDRCPRRIERCCY